MVEHVRATLPAILILGLGLVGCAPARATPPPTVTPPPVATPERPPATEDETKIDDAWIRAAAPETGVVAREEALRFGEAAFDAIHRHIHDPVGFAEPERRARAEASRVLGSRPAWTRGEVVDAINPILKATYGISHLGVATPTKVRAMLGLDAPPSAPPDDAVRAEVRGRVGIVHIDSFMVPAIRRASVAKAFEVVRDAPALLIDLRGNGGGSQSSVVYVAQSVLGPGVKLHVSRTRRATSRRTAHQQRAFFPDDVNEASHSDVQLLKREGWVEYWTPDHAPRPPVRPTFLLIDEGCRSSCEIFAADLVEAGSALALGRRTAGAVLAAEGVRGRWEGYLIVVPFGTTVTPHGNSLEGRGVEPHVVLPQCDPGGDAAACLDAALAHVVAAAAPAR